MSPSGACDFELDLRLQRGSSSDISFLDSVSASYLTGVCLGCAALCGEEISQKVQTVYCALCGTALVSLVVSH